VLFRSQRHRTADGPTHLHTTLPAYDGTACRATPKEPT